MSLATSILTIIGSVLSLIVGYYFKDLIREILQKFQDKKNEEDLADARKQAQSDNQKANAESDKLKHIDGR